MTPVSDTDRDRAVQRIQEAYAQGRLDHDALEERLEQVLLATSHGELEPVLHGLPDDDVVRLTSTGGRLTRAGDWRVPRMLRIDSEYGHVRLDLSRAAIDYPRIDIELRLAYGSAVVTLPPGAAANIDGVHTAWGSVTSDAPEHSGRPHVRITGELGYGRLKVRCPRTWRRPVH